jgi:hypothetical protein
MIYKKFAVKSFCANARNLLIYWIKFKILSVLYHSIYKKFAVTYSKFAVPLTYKKFAV